MGTLTIVEARAELETIRINVQKYRQNHELSQLRGSIIQRGRFKGQLFIDALCEDTLLELEINEKETYLSTSERILEAISGAADFSGRASPLGIDFLVSIKAFNKVLGVLLRCNREEVV